MTKKRKIELWNLVLNKIETGNHNGVCMAICSLWLNWLINWCDFDILIADLKKYKPKKTYVGFYFEPYLKEPRIKLIKKIINNLKNNLKNKKQKNGKIQKTSRSIKSTSRI